MRCATPSPRLRLFRSLSTSSSCYAVSIVFFFFQAEDGIRDWSVTGVQTCALPISLDVGPKALEDAAVPSVLAHQQDRRAAGRGGDESSGQKRGRMPELVEEVSPRSEERRVGKECRSRWSREH